MAIAYRDPRELAAFHRKILSKNEHCMTQVRFLALYDDETEEPFDVPSVRSSQWRIIARQVELYPRRLKRTGSPGTKLTLGYYAVRSTNKLKLEKPLPWVSWVRIPPSPFHGSRKAKGLRAILDLAPQIAPQTKSPCLRLATLPQDRRNGCGW